MPDRNAPRISDGQRILCCACNDPASTRHQMGGLPVCRGCWRRLTPEGRDYVADAVRRSRARKAATPTEEV